MVRTNTATSSGMRRKNAVQIAALLHAVIAAILLSNSYLSGSVDDKSKGSTAAERLRAALDKANEKEFELAIAALADSGGDKYVLETLIPFIEYCDPKVQLLAISGIGRCRNLNVNAVGALTRVAADPNWPRECRIRALIELGLRGVRYKSFAQKLETCLKDRNPHIRINAAVAVFRMSGEAQATLAVVRDVIIRKFEAGDVTSRESAISALKCFGPKAKAASSDLLLIINPPGAEWPVEDYHTRIAACQVLPLIAKDDDSVVPHLVNGLERFADYASKLGSLEVDPLARAAVSSYIRKERFAFHNALSSYGKVAAGQLADRVSKSNNNEFVLFSIGVFRTIGADAIEALPVIDKLAKTSEGVIREQAELAARELRIEHQPKK